MVHYYENEKDTPGPPEVLALPSSATGRKAVISVETLGLAAKVRASGAKLVLVSGTRYSTLVNRLPFLPRADAYVIENGGRIFYPRKKAAEPGDAAASSGGGEPSSEVAAAGGGEGEAEKEESAVGDPTLTAHAASALTEDLKWRETMESATGPASQDAKAPEDREGPLWDLYRTAVAQGFEVDTNTYYTMIRCALYHLIVSLELFRALFRSRCLMRSDVITHEGNVSGEWEACSFSRRFCCSWFRWASGLVVTSRPVQGRQNKPHRLLSALL